MLILYVLHENIILFIYSILQTKSGTTGLFNFLSDYIADKLSPLLSDTL